MTIEAFKMNLMNYSIVILKQELKFQEKKLNRYKKNIETLSDLKTIQLKIEDLKRAISKCTPTQIENSNKKGGITFAELNKQIKERLKENDLIVDHEINKKYY